MFCVRTLFLIILLDCARAHPILESLESLNYQLHNHFRECPFRYPSERSLIATQLTAKPFPSFTAEIQAIGRCGKDLWVGTIDGNMQVFDLDSLVMMEHTIGE